MNKMKRAHYPPNIITSTNKGFKPQDFSLLFGFKVSLHRYDWESIDYMTELEPSSLSFHSRVQGWDQKHHFLNHITFFLHPKATLQRTPSLLFNINSSF